MKLSDASFKITYSSYEDDLASDFYIKALSLASEYNRASAYFDSKILALYSTGISEIYKNNGKIRFVFSYDLPEEDFKLMDEGYKNKDIIENGLLNNMKNQELTLIDEKRLSNLAFLIQEGIVEIKIAFTKTGIFHDKFGLIIEGEECLYFRGSTNETLAAVINNYEGFEISCSWHNERNENIKINNAKKRFDNLWNNRTKGVIVLDIPNVVKNEIIKFSKGEVTFEKDILFGDAIVLDLNEDNILTAKNNTKDNYDLYRDWTYKVFIKAYTDSELDSFVLFKSELNYIQIEKIVNYFSSLCSKNGLNLYVTEKLKTYINERNLEIEIRQNLGIDIKNMSETVVDKYQKFKNVVDSEMERELRNKQMWDAFHAVSMWKSANFSVPGSGKTSIVYGAFAYLNSKAVDKVDRIIMIGPMNSFLAWKEEFVANFGNKKKLNLINIKDNTQLRTTNEKISALRFESENKNLILINYDILKSLEEVLKEIIDERTLLVFDEVHKVKAVEGKRAASALEISKKAKYKIVLTGTPIPNSYQDIYNLLNILYADEYSTYFRFSINELANPTERLIETINTRIYPFYCRTTKKDLLIPVPNDDNVLKAIMNEKERKLFEMIRKKYSHQLFSLYIRLLQASTNPKLLLSKIDDNQLRNLLSIEEDEEIAEKRFFFEKIDKEVTFSAEEIEIINSVDVTTKYEKGITMVSSLAKEGKQVLVWGIFVSTLQNIKKSLDVNGISSKIIDGSVPQEDREKIINEFKNQEFSVLITNPHTMAESVSLHKTCHDAVYFEYSFNLTHMLQSRDRINRLGLPENQYTQYYYLMLSHPEPFYDSIDEKTYFRLKEKEEIMLKSIEGTKLERVEFDDLDDLQRILSDI